MNDVNNWEDTQIDLKENENSAHLENVESNNKNADSIFSENVENNEKSEDINMTNIINDDKYEKHILGEKFFNPNVGDKNRFVKKKFNASAAKTNEVVSNSEQVSKMIKPKRTMDKLTINTSKVERGFNKDYIASTNNRTLDTFIETSKATINFEGATNDEINNTDFYAKKAIDSLEYKNKFDNSFKPSDKTEKGALEKKEDVLRIYNDLNAYINDNIKDLGEENGEYDANEYSKKIDTALEKAKSAIDEVKTLSNKFKNFGNMSDSTHNYKSLYNIDYANISDTKLNEAFLSDKKLFEKITSEKLTEKIIEKVNNIITYAKKAKGNENEAIKKKETAINYINKSGVVDLLEDIQVVKNAEYEITDYANEAKDIYKKANEAYQSVLAIDKNVADISKNSTLASKIVKQFIDATENARRIFNYTIKAENNIKEAINEIKEVIQIIIAAKEAVTEANNAKNISETAKKTSILKDATNAAAITTIKVHKANVALETTEKHVKQLDLLLVKKKGNGETREKYTKKYILIAKDAADNAKKASEEAKIAVNKLKIEIIKTVTNKIVIVAQNATKSANAAKKADTIEEAEKEATKTNQHENDAIKALKEVKDVGKNFKDAETYIKISEDAVTEAKLANTEANAAVNKIKIINIAKNYVKKSR
ncbi:uncharacterized protein PF11_0213-like [Piliocolobus tephrosceles]|uniref:uncharacterized protein PF11_0213-like n=1 Tax=Piliocolobus tephrosceles TaxID=591936 RepID=UPI000E6AFF3B|nr:uncharacterized protein PF11_0213-like [Piliocolobus tephrosceles]